MDDYQDGAGRVSLGRVFGRAFGVISDNPKTVLGLAFLLGTLPSLVVDWSERSLRTTQLDGTQQLGVAVIGVVSFFLTLALTVIVQGALVRATMAYSTGERATLGESFSAGLRMLLPLLGLTVLELIGIAFGFALFFIPAIILFVMWSVAAPALVAERCGVFEAFTRSRELTRGSRWKIFGLLLVVLVTYWLLLGVYGVMVFASTNTTMEGLAQGGQIPLMWILGSALLSLINQTLWGTVGTSLYVELRNAKEGGTEQALSEIFA